jgi:hypothetical protein
MRRVAVLATAGVIVLLLVVAQLVLPGIAAQRLRDQLARSGEGVKIDVSAFPAIELLWHQADSVTVHVTRYRSSTADLAAKLTQTADAGSVDATATELDTGPLTLRDATLRKRGDQLTGSARVTQADLRTALPFIQNVHLVASGAGQLTLRGTGSLLVLTATVDATVRAQGGRLIVVPDVPFLPTVTVFDDRHVEIQRVSGAGVPDGFTVSAQARLH